MLFFSESFISSGKQGGAVVPVERRDIVTGETCIPTFLNVNNLGEAAVLHLPLLWPGAVPILPYRKTSYEKAVELHLTLLMFSSHKFLHSPHASS
jgi:hypothetical protein